MEIILNGKLQIQITQYFLSYKPFYFKIKHSKLIVSFMIQKPILNFQVEKKTCHLLIFINIKKKKKILKVIKKSHLKKIKEKVRVSCFSCKLFSFQD